MKQFQTMSQSVSRIIEIVLATASAVAAACCMWYLWSYINSPAYNRPPHSPGYHGPFPFYLLEVVLLGALGLFCVVRDSSDNTLWGSLLWALVGALGGLVVLGLWSIGPWVFPAFIGFLVTAVLGGYRSGRKLLALAGWFFLGFAVQVSLMLSVVYYMTQLRAPGHIICP